MISPGDRTDQRPTIHLNPVTLFIKKLSLRTNLAREIFFDEIGLFIFNDDFASRLCHSRIVSKVIAQNDLPGAICSLVQGGTDIGYVWKYHIMNIYSSES